MEEDGNIPATLRIYNGFNGRLISVKDEREVSHASPSVVVKQRF
jgi:hypothetical protein